MDRRLLIALLTTLALCTGPLVLAAPPASAANVEQDHLVSDTPSSATPNILNGMTESLAKVGSQIVAGGSFTSVAPAGSTSGVTRNHVVAFDASTGSLNQEFKPDVNGRVMAVEPGPTPHTVYIGGNFTQVDGVAIEGIALLDTTDGQLVPGFNPPSIKWGYVRSVRLAGGRLFIAGNFDRVGGSAHMGLATLDPETGSLDPYMDLQLAGHHNYEGGAGQAKAGVGAVAMDVSTDTDRMVVIGNFTSVSGAARDQIAVISLGASSASVVQSWATDAYTARCFDWAFDTYMRAVNFSPDGSYFVVAATGGSGINDDGTNSSCDTAARYETSANGSDLRPTWINYTGQDTLTAVAVTGAAVYVGGHERWMNNSKGHDNASEGAVPRPGLAALNPRTGMPYTWNPGRNPRGIGTHALLSTPDGLYAGYDTNFIGNRQYRRERVAKFPLAGGESVKVPAGNSLPAEVYLAEPTDGDVQVNKSKKSTSMMSDAGPRSTKSQVLYRVNSGGPAISSTDDGPDWVADRAPGDPGSRYCGQPKSIERARAKLAVSTDVSRSTPTSVFDTRRAGGNGKSGKIRCSFKVPSGAHVQIRVYFAGQGKKVSEPGDSVLDVTVDGKQALAEYDVSADVGGGTGTMKSFDVTSTGEVQLAVAGLKGGPFLNGIEIVGLADSAQATDSSILARSFDGTAVGETKLLDTGMDWSEVRGAFIVGEHVFYGSTDGYLHERSFDGQTFGDDTKIDPYDDPKWSNVSTGSGQTYRGAKPDLYAQFGSVTGMFYLDGRIYYSMRGDKNLYWRWFEPSSGIIGSDTFTISGGDFSDIAGMFYADGHIYYADSDTDDLVRMGFDGTDLDSPSATVVSGPTKDGNDWGAGAIFVGSPAQAPNEAPNADFDASCEANICDFDASKSSDSDGSIVSYEWSFGDSSSASGKTQTHAYSAAGDYDVSLTVTDSDGATDTVTHQVSPGDAPASAISFVGAAHSGDGAAKSKSVVIPGQTKAGDAVLLFLTQHTSDDWSDIGDGWRKVGSITNHTIMSTLWVKEASSADAGMPVTIHSDKYTKSDLSVSVYSGVDVSQVAAASSGDSRTTDHVTPTLEMSQGDLAVSYWADKSSSTTEWTAPKAVTVRDSDVGTGAGRFSQVLADSGTAVGSGNYGGLTATTDAPSGKAVMWTVSLSPGSAPGNQDPEAAFTASCDQGVCSFDGSGSSDSDGSVESYRWDFGDGSNGTGKTVSHIYTNSDQATVELVVSDNDGATDTVTHEISPGAPAGISVRRVAGDHSGTGASKSKHVTVPENIQPGDTMVLFFTRASSNTWSSPDGDWSEAGSVTNGSIESSVWVKDAEAGDPGGTIRLSTDQYTKGVLVLAVYAGVDTDAVRAAHSADSWTSSHTTPTVPIAAGDVAISFWSDKSSSTTEWSAPKGVTTWATAVGTGAGRYSFLVADSGSGASSSGTYGGLTAITDARSGKAAMWTVVLPLKSVDE